MININLSKAKDIWRDKLRLQRNPLFTELDIKFVRALETNDTEEQHRIKNIKQELRDITKDPRIEKVKNTEELKSLNLIEKIITIIN